MRTNSYIDVGGLGGKQADVAARFGTTRSSVIGLVRKAKERGYNPSDYTALTMEHVIDEQRSVAKDKLGRAANACSIAGQPATRLQFALKHKDGLWRIGSGSPGVTKPALFLGSGMGVTAS
ncbi:hypothetical protein TWF970_000735 [Orbilia oligospora]|uniref:Uncharacterized protein n=1 Tax=Orbilia oligospora TaxID=2813651 RepID=A0A7C8RLS0_ORBOL|nr:hypothetical protein TWF970_000735 [Orbilia oligospora]